MFKVRQFPKKYIMKRWTKEVVPNEINHTIDNEEFGYCKNDKAKQIAREIIRSGEYLINNLITEVDELSLVRDQMKEMIVKVDQRRFSRPSMSKYDRFSTLLGYDKNTEVTVRVPTGIRNKGSGSHKRFKSKREQAISRAGKRTRTCHVCGEKGHDIRTCGKRANAKEQESEKKKQNERQEQQVDDEQVEEELDDE